MLRKLLTGSLIAALMTGTAGADTLRDALVSAYQTNPTLTAQRQTLEATDATVAIARAAGRPQINGTVGLNRDLSQSGVLNTGGKGPTLSVGANVSYPLFNGGSVRNSVRAAQTRVEAGRATLRAVEGDVFAQAGHALPPEVFDVALQRGAEGAVVPETVEPAIDLAGLEDEAAALAKAHDLFHAGDAGVRLAHREEEPR